MTDALKEMIHDGDWFGVAKAITREHVENQGMGDDRFADNITRAVDYYLDAQELSEQEQDGDPEESSDTMNGNEMWRNIGGRA